MNYKEHVESYGYVNEHSSGAWQQVFILCPHCHAEEAMAVEVDTEQEGGAFADLYCCKKCSAFYRIAYRMEVIIHIEPENEG